MCHGREKQWMALTLTAVSSLTSRWCHILHPDPLKWNSTMVTLPVRKAKSDLSVSWWIKKKSPTQRKNVILCLCDFIQFVLTLQRWCESGACRSCVHRGSQSIWTWFDSALKPRHLALSNRITFIEGPGKKNVKKETKKCDAYKVNAEAPELIGCTEINRSRAFTVCHNNRVLCSTRCLLWFWISRAVYIEWWLLSN